MAEIAHQITIGLTDIWQTRIWFGMSGIVGMFGGIALVFFGQSYGAPSRIIHQIAQIFGPIVVFGGCLCWAVACLI